MYTLLPRKLPNPDEDLIFFLKQHYIGCKPEMVNDYIIKEAHILHENESLEKEHLKFFRILLKDFLVKSCIDAKNWNAIHFATALKVICYPKASYEVYRPDKIFPCGVHQKMKDHSSEYDTMFAKIDALSVYNFVISLSSEKFLILSELDILVTKAKEELKIAGAIRCKDRSPGKRKTNRIDLQTHSIVRKEASTNDDGKLYNKLDFSCEKQEHDVKQTLTTFEENPPMEKSNGLCKEEIRNKRRNQGQHWLDSPNYADVPPQVKRRLLRRERILQRSKGKGRDVKSCRLGPNA
ncbi:uncharacterized protein [Triticum aestivum]|uniref:uncharacterized protein n=1 Tax=Triticum aestivum TaxID=4565 RepID=UPI001D027D8B|nr:uncharacterized protein LOC123042866 [Triticum aestivum]XP_044321174.1 uncharacterized protein LOC123042867 [Triticum aestivum]